VSLAERQHRMRRMTGRDPDEPHRGATPLELLFDLTFVAAFAQAGDQAAHLLAEGHFAHAAVAFGFVAFAVCWAWVNFSWFASAFDTDDWFFRVTTMVQMVGVLVLALGTPPIFDSIDHGEPLDNGVVVAGYIVMRVAMLALWLRAAMQAPRHRRFALVFAASIAVAQLGWTAVLFLDLPLGRLLPILIVLYAIELGGPVVAARAGRFPPWHAHHIAERYGLLVIITLGEIVLGAIAAVAAVVERVGWSMEAVLVAVAGTGLAFGIWWTYFVVPAGEVLKRHRRRAWVWGYGGIVIFASVAAMGAGLHVAAYVVEGEASIGVVDAVLTIAVPVLVTVVAYFAIYSYLVGEVDPFHLLLFVGTAAALAAAVLLAALGVGLGVCLIVVMLAPAVIVVGYETVGHRHMAGVLERVMD
jgi:low temperature requirement protein LtrA